MENSIKDVFISMTILELNTLQRICELGRTQFPTILARYVRNHQFHGYHLKGYVVVLNFLHLCMKLVNVLIIYQYVIKTK